MISKTVKQTSEHERRRHARFPQTLEIEACNVPPLSSRGHSKPLPGRALNVSRGGFCLVTQKPIDRSSLMLCHIGVSEGIPTIPTLALVRWTKKQNVDDDSYLSGLQFVF